MNPLKGAAEDFLSSERIAVAGVSRSPAQAANGIYRKLRSEGYTVVPINPSAGEVEGDPCYPDLASVPDPIEGVIIATHPDVTPEVVRECARLGIRRVWMHRSFGPGSVSEEAVRICREHGIAVIPGACPLMFCRSADVGHRCIRWWLGVRGALPEPQRPGREPSGSDV
jgi:predicted CoA-binding protein